jgi:putative thioredoxin
LGGPTADLIKDSSDRAFVADVIEASRDTPVLVDFWAPWCGPCRTLTPTLEKVVNAAKGKVKLVKINIDQNPAFAGKLGVQSIPAVFAFKGGQPVDAFMGALPESQVRMFIDRLAGDAGPELEAMLAEARTALDSGDFGGAAQLYAQVLQVDQENRKALAGIARCYIGSGEFDPAREILDMIGPDGAKDPDVASARAALELAENAADPAEVRALQAAYDANPADPQARFDLAVALGGAGKVEAAIDHLLDMIAADREWNESAARTQLLKLFEATGSAHPAVKAGRRRFSAIWFS